MIRTTRATVKYEAPKMEILQILTEQICLAASYSGSNLDDMCETEGEWAGLI